MSDDESDAYPLDENGEEDSELVQVSHLVPENLRDLATERTDYGGLSELVREAYRIGAMGTEAGKRRMRYELRRIRQDREHLEARREDIDEELAELAEHESRIEDELEDSRRYEEVIEDRFEEVEAKIREGRAVFPGHSDIADLSALASITESEVIERLKERNPDLPEHAFEDQRFADRSWEGTSDSSRVDDR